MAKELTQVLTSAGITSPAPLQKDILCHRFTVNRIAGKYEYRLYQDRIKVQTLSSDKDCSYALISNNNGILRIDSIRVSLTSFEQRILEDPTVFIISIQKF